MIKSRFIPRIVLIGPTGVGKSLIANSILQGEIGDDESQHKFKSSNSTKSCTMNCESVLGRILGVEDEI